MQLPNAFHSFVQRKCQGKVRLSAAEAKLFALFLYYGISILFMLSNFSAYLRTSDSIANTLLDHIICSAGGDKAECHAISERLHDVVTTPLIMKWIAITIRSFASIVHLNLVFRYSDIKKAIGYLLAKVIQSLHSY